MFLRGPVLDIVTFQETRLLMNLLNTLGLSRKHLRILTGLLTGHVALNRHLTVMKIHTDPMCHKCGEEEETADHFFSKCDAIMMVRYSIFGSCLMQVSELQQVQPHTLLTFARASKRFI